MFPVPAADGISGVAGDVRNSGRLAQLPLSQIIAGNDAHRRRQQQDMRQDQLSPSSAMMISAICQTTGRLTIAGDSHTQRKRFAAAARCYAIIHAEKNEIIFGIDIVCDDRTEGEQQR